MAQNQSTNPRQQRGPGALSRWMQQKANARLNRKIRAGRGDFMGMSVLILNTTGRRSGQPRETPLAWFADGSEPTDNSDSHGARLVVASGGGDQHPDWFANLMAHPERASIELPGQPPLPVIPRRLDADERERAWQRIVAVQPRYGKYQAKSDREYPVIRLTPR